MPAKWVRTHDCGTLSASDIGKKVSLCGWVSTRRDHGGLVFVDLRDRFGLTQVVFDPELPGGGKQTHETAGSIRNEFVLWCQGTVRHRPEGMTNTTLKTGEIEVACHSLEILSEAETPPFPIEDDIDVSENLRLKYRYLDLRRPFLQKNLAMRSKVLSVVRNHLTAEGFLEIETPLLYKTTPEGARDFLVPSRLAPGNFYALPQSPQTLKQLLMIAGMDRYFQIARCFRDEDFRADRQPEFSQIDIEASFVEPENLFPIFERMLARIWKDALDVDVSLPFPRMTYREALYRYGTDKPDTRFDLELQDISAVFEESEFRVFQQALKKSPRGKKGSVRCIVVRGKATQYSRKDLDDLTAHAHRYGAKGLLWMKLEDELKSPAAKFLSDAEKKNMISTLGLTKGDLVLAVADANNNLVCTSMGAIRLYVGKKEGLIPGIREGKPRFLFVTRFPLVEYDEREKRYFASHHPFTSPQPEQFDRFLKGEDLESIDSSAYDIVVNGVELGSGSLRIFRPDIQSAMFRVLGMSEKDAQEKFGFFMEALRYGTPPHAGFAFGLDRLVAIVCGAAAIRDVMAFPKTQKGTCLMSDSPSPADPEHLAELGVSVKRKK